MAIKNTQKNSEGGFAAIIIAIVLVTVLSLLTIGFADLMRKEQKSALERQLSNTAYYAAESGINDAMQAIAQGYNTQKTDCGPLAAATGPGEQFLTDNRVADPADGDPVIYSCLLIDPTPNDITFKSVGRQSDNSKVVKLVGVDPTDGVTPREIRRVIVSWKADDDKPVFAQSGWFTSGQQFRADADWVNGGEKVTGVLRAEITPLSILNRDVFRNTTLATFIYPHPTGGGTVSLNYADAAGQNAGTVISGNCSTSKTPYYCSAEITNLPGGLAGYLLRLNSIYKNSTIRVQAFDSVGQVALKDAQIIIDSTGNARGVVKRVQVRVPKETNTYYPQYSLEGLSGICKSISVEPNSAVNSCP